ncbi:MAG: twin-arginine translocation pathway signal protein [Amylibacter sp.]|nr:twin-arginine translocation pathway signal protein [Amylibacter sp.]
MGKSDDGKTSSRRSFLKLAAVSAPAAVAATTLTTTTATAATQQGSSGLRDTTHTRAYLESAKF